ncbi:MAG: ribosome small subunit-dependent GTPase A [Spirochaetales bacterium]|nr:ribosome small subunit-dependent GTPase A [Spirochaetales bacterium]
MKGQSFVGTVSLGINNIYTVITDTGKVECRIKGKVLKGEKVYNPLTVGDRVEVEPDTHDAGKGLILKRFERKNVFSRYNRKRNAPQVILANVDVLACITSWSSPPFRPRFLDRVLIAAAIGDLEPVIIVNKSDLSADSESVARINIYREIGYRVLFCSALSGEGIDMLREEMRTQVWGFLGQSGVGKSSILNALMPGLDAETGAVSKKHDRGSHTTCYAAMFSRDDLTLIDTPGIREIDICGIEAMDLGYYFREFQPYVGNCDFSPCLHDHEPGCRVKEAVEKGLIHPDRYESYLRTLAQLQGETGSTQAKG